jgi:two-component system, sensor histidine kinase and response regulator
MMETMTRHPALLLVDDRAENLLALEAVLEPLGHPMVRAESGEEALRRLLAEDFAVIVLDVQMPGMDGFETAEQIKQRERTRDIPIIFLTAMSRDAEHRMQGFGVGAVDYIFKPVEPDLLRAKVSVFVELFQKNRLLDEQRAALAAELRERQRAERRLALKSEELERSNADLEQFAYIASHDLQEPLRVMAGYLELLDERSGPELDDTGRQWIAKATRMAERMSALLSDLLAFARAGAGSREALPVDLDEAVGIAVDNLGTVIRETGAEIKADHVLGTVRAAPSEMVQILQNLIANAVKYRGTADPVVRVTAESHDGMVQVAVSDNGRGVPDEHLERVFGMFERVDGGPYPGTGLGLAVCRRLVERGGGRVWMEPNKGSGVTVRFTVPAATS